MYWVYRMKKSECSTGCNFPHAPSMLRAAEQASSNMYVRTYVGCTGGREARRREAEAEAEKMKQGSSHILVE